MKNFTLLPFTVVLLASCSAQHVNLDRYYFSASYHDLPRMALDTSYKTYSAEVDAGPLTRTILHREDPSQQVYIDGWGKVDEGGDIDVHTRFEDVIIEKADVEERVEVLKDKDGKETGKRSHFASVLTYSYGARMRVVDYRGTLLQDLPLSTRQQKRTYRTAEYNSKAEAEAYMKFNLIPVTAQITRQVVNNTLANISRTLSIDYGFPLRNVNDYMWILASRKSPEYEKHRQAWAVVKQAMFGMSADAPLDQVRADIQPAIDYFENVIRTYTSSSKSDRKLRYASYYNLAKIYYYLDDPDDAMREATALELNNFDSRDGRQLEAAATELKRLLQQSKLSSRHFASRVPDATAPAVTSSSNK